MRIFEGFKRSFYECTTTSQDPTISWNNVDYLRVMLKELEHE